MLAGVQTRRVDITIGGCLTAERQKQGLPTDPPYYFTACDGSQGRQEFQTVEDLQGLNLGTVEGYVWVKSIQAVPGAKLHACPDATGVFDDLRRPQSPLASRPAADHRGPKQRPDLGIETQPRRPLRAGQGTPDYQYSSRT
jgi:polar amino acid transport system substrate-binding protein